MSNFTKHSAIVPTETEKGWTWVLSEPLAWEVRNAVGDVTDEIDVPVGFYTDLGSIPWFGRWLFNPADPQCAKAYILHDWLLHLWGGERMIEAAGVLYQALKVLEISIWRRVIITLAVIAGIDTW